MWVDNQRDYLRAKRWNKVQVLKLQRHLKNYSNNGECFFYIAAYLFLHILSNHIMHEKPPYVTFLLTLILSYPGDWILRNKRSIDHQFAHSPCFFYKYPIFPTGVFVQQSKALIVANQWYLKEKLETRSVTTYPGLDTTPWQVTLLFQ